MSCRDTDFQAGDPYEVVCMYVLEEEGQKDAFNLQAVLSIDADGQSASVKAVTTYEIYMEEYVEQMFLHSLWIPDWTMLIMGVSAATDILVLSGEESVCQGQSWAPLGLPEGKQLNCPHSTDSNDTTKLRGLCLLTSFKGKVARKDTGTEMVAPPVVLLAASDGTVSFHYCDHDLPAPQRPSERPRASGLGLVDWEKVLGEGQDLLEFSAQLKTHKLLW
eukprot:symbB.v1.2.027561.t1/scaffold2838.1/size69213/2